jgi:hypothetical protein
VCCAALAAGVLVVPAGAQELARGPARLWQIGKSDGDDREFALAPGGYRDFAEDGFFAVGESDSARDWPYVQPGPADAWAGGRAHTFTVSFALREAPRAGECRLTIAFVDTHNQDPPELAVAVNGVEVARRRLERGAGDASVYGEPSRGKPQKLEIDFPAARLLAGDNEIRLTSAQGSWLLYDWLALDAPPELALAPASARTFVGALRPIRALVEREGRFLQPLRVELRHFGEKVSARIAVERAAPAPFAIEESFELERGASAREILLPAVAQPTEVALHVAIGGQEIAARTATLQPVGHLTVYILPHSHTDIGYTAIQTSIEQKQVDNLLAGIQAARRTADYPPGARFVWNVEVLWAADLYLRRLSDAQRAEFVGAVKNGQVALNGMYLNELTGLCRPEELLRLFRCATELASRCGVAVDSAMISDVPGYTWGTVTAMAQAGIRYFSAAPNYSDRIGDILVEWENKPFWWVSPSGRERVLVWIPYKGYALSHGVRALAPPFADEYQEALASRGYPYEIAYMRWSGHGDNAVPEPELCDFVRDWNARYAWPRFLISSTSEAFRAFEQRYGAGLPVVRGDWTPYWEDGAGSSAAETSQNRWSSDRMSQAQALWAMLDPHGYPAADFEDAWRNVLLYSEHTWGAWCSVSDPENAATREQWKIKQSYARTAERASRELLARAAEKRAPAAAAPVADALDVFNTSSWPRSELVTWRAGPGQDLVLNDRGEPVPSQRLLDGDLAFVAGEVPAFGARRFTLRAGAPFAKGEVRVQADTLENERLRARLDAHSGALVELVAKDLGPNFVDLENGGALDDYLFLAGSDLAKLERNGPATLRIGEHGPLVASLIAESQAPGCKRLVRELRLSAGTDFVELANLLDKQRAATPAQPGDWDFAQHGGKESVNFAFPFRIEGGELWLDLPLGAMRPGLDQLPSACKNWFSIGRWAEVANAERAITWVTLDAPLVEVGGITANLVGSQSDPKVWRKTVEPTQKLYSWAMNNHWSTNYRAYQEGEVTFRYVLRPKRKRDPAEATRFATGFSQPLLVLPARGAAPSSVSRLSIEPADVLVIGLEPIAGGRALLVRLFGASGQTCKATLRWSAPAPEAVFASDTSGKAGARLEGPVEVPGFGVVTLRAEFGH